MREINIENQNLGIYKYDEVCLGTIPPSILSVWPRPLLPEVPHRKYRCLHSLRLRGELT